RRHGVTRLDVRGSGHGAVELIGDAGRYAARRKRQYGAEEELARAAGALGGARALDRQVVRAAAVLQLVGPAVRDGGTDAAQAARGGARAAGQRDRDVAVADDRRTVCDAGPARVEDGFRIRRITREVDLARARAVAVRARERGAALAVRGGAVAELARFDDVV